MKNSRTAEALLIIQNAGMVYPKGFAQAFWPDSTMHVKRSNGGHGSQAGKAAWLCAGSYMGKLIKKGLVRHSADMRGYLLTDLGKQFLKQQSEL